MQAPSCAIHKSMFQRPLAYARRPTSQNELRAGALVLSCFLLTSLGWMLWMDRLSCFESTPSVEFLTLVASYLVQAGGVAAYIACARYRPAHITSRTCTVTILLFVALLLPVVFGSFAAVVSCGMVANLPCGMLQAHYVTRLAQLVKSDRRATVFGRAYAASTVACWLLTRMTEGLEQGLPGLALCCVLAIPSMCAMTWVEKYAQTGPSDPSASPEPNGVTNTFAPTFALCSALVLLMSITKSLGFGFPMQDLVEGVDLATSRLFYGTGLLIAGFVFDRDRSWGMLCCVCSLMLPFVSLALIGAGISAITLWALSYLLFGFFTVYRVVLLADLASSTRQLWLASAGLMFGRLGDALGSAANLALASHTVALIALAAAFFVATMWVAHYGQRLHVSAEPLESEPMPPDSVPASQEPPAIDERAVFEAYVQAHDLSSRQQEVLRLMLDGLTNQQIGTKLVVSNNTVKFHVRNVLHKTGCSNRTELQQSYKDFGRS